LPIVLKIYRFFFQVFKKHQTFQDKICFNLRKFLLGII